MTRARLCTALAGVAACIASACPAATTDRLLAGRTAVVRGGALARVVARPAGGARVALPGGVGDPTVGGGTLRILDVGIGGAGDVTFVLPAARWTRRGGAASPRRYRYRGRGTAGDPCRTVVVGPRLVKAVCRGAGVTLAPPFAGDVAVILALGAEGVRYCATFGGTAIENRAGRSRHRAAPAPAACGGCACGTPPPARVAFTAGVGSGACGVAAGGAGTDLACGGLYFGGGGGSTPVPAVFPDFAEPLLFAVRDCVGEHLALARTTAEETGPGRRCSGEGCTFGAPIPLPNPASVPTSTCLYNGIAADAEGTLACGAGAAAIDLPLETAVYLNGDLLPNRCAGGTNPGGRCTPATAAADCPGGGACEPDAGVQACPVCNPATGVCNGGPRNGLACVPDSDDVTGAPYPTSHDCPSSDLVRLGTLPVALALTTGTVTKTAVPSGTQQRVFCGYCRDAATTGTFAGPPAVPCGSDADCPPPFPSCEQMHQGAFRNAGATDITEYGRAAGPLVDGGAHDSTLVSVFCVPPTYNGLIDNSGDLPGPGALGLAGTLQLVP